MEDWTKKKLKPEETTEQDCFLAQVLGVFQSNSPFYRERVEANAELMMLLTQYLIDNPHERFGQALRNLDIVLECAEPTRRPPLWLNAYNTEPMEMLKRAKTALAKRT